jgi:dihydropteroate synthase
VPQVLAFLERQSQRLERLAVARERIAWDPGIGFGKTIAQNFALLARQSELLAAGYPLLVGWSRKSSLGVVSGMPAGERLVPSVAAALLAVERGARVVRVHDVRETVAALKVWSTMVDHESSKGRDVN